jgi:long-chain acyl-CoA synthetase
MAMLDNLGQILPRAAKRFGSKTALICGERCFSFLDLEELSARLGNALRGLGIGRGDRVTLYGQNCWEWIISYYAVARIGAVINPINVMLTPEEVLYVVQDCGAKAVLASQDKGEALLDIKRDSPLHHVVLFGDAHRGSHSLTALLSAASNTLDEVPLAADEVSTIAYTSGTTGHPKGAVLTQRNVVCNSGLTATMHVRNCSDTVVTALPAAHVYGNVIMNGAFMCGMTLVLFPRFNELEVLNAIEQHRATMFEGVPTMYMYLLKCAELGKHSLASLTRCTVGGQTMPISKMQEVEERFGCPLLELWGMTEIAGLGTTHPLYGTNRLGSIGVPLPYVECRIADVLEAERTLPTGDVGELMVRGPIVMKGYYGNPKATTDAIEPDGWLHTGDLARIDSDGYIYAVDRKKDMILTGGYNVYPAEIERIIAGHPEVAMVAVGSQPDETKGEVARAYIVLKNGAAPDPDSILAYCRQHLAAYKVPRSVQFVPDLPKTSTGKVLRRQLKTLDS